MILYPDTPVLVNSPPSVTTVSSAKARFHKNLGPSASALAKGQGISFSAALARTKQEVSSLTPDGFFVHYTTNASKFCGRGIGSSGFYCLETNCTTNHRFGSILPGEDSVFVPAFGQKTRAFAQPSVMRSSVSAQVWDRLVDMRGDATFLKGALTNVSEMVRAGASDDLILQCLVTQDTFQTTVASLAMTPGKPLKEAVRGTVSPGEKLKDYFDLFLDTFPQDPDAFTSTSFEYFGNENAKDVNVRMHALALGAAGECLRNTSEGLEEHKALLQGLAGRLSTQIGLSDNAGFDDGTSLWSAVSELKLKQAEVKYQLDYKYQAMSDTIRQLDSLATDNAEKLRIGNVCTDDGSFLPAPSAQGGSPLFFLIQKAFTHICEKIDTNCPPNGGDTSIVDPHSLDGLQTQVHGEFKVLLEDVNQIRVELDRVKADGGNGGIKITGIDAYESENDLYLFLSQLNAGRNIPENLWGLVFDPWNLLDAIGDSNDAQKSDNEVAKDTHNRQKVKMTTKQLRILAGVLRNFPLTFEPAGTPESDDLFLRPFYSLKKSVHWLTKGFGSCRYRKVASVLTQLESQYRTDLQRVIPGVEHIQLYNLLMAMFNMSVAHVKALFSWMDTKYSEEEKTSSSTEAWSLVTGCVAGYLSDLKKRRYWGDDIDDVAVDPLRTLSKVIWSFGRSLTLSQTFFDADFGNHQTCVAVYTAHMNRSRATKTEVEQLMKKIEEMAKTISSLTGRITKMEKS